MSILSVAIVGFGIVILIFSFSYWAGAKILDRHSDFFLDKQLRFERVYSVYLKNDPYQFIYKFLKLTKLYISETELLVIGAGKFSAYFTHMNGISNRVKISELQVSKVSDNTMELHFEVDGFDYTLCISGQNTAEILGHLKS